MTPPRSSPAQRVAIAVIRWYQRYVSPRTPPTCRFTPTCSEYAAQAIRRYGVLHGIWLGTLRILRCNPWCPGGYDPVPGAESDDATPTDFPVNG